MPSPPPPPDLLTALRRLSIWQLWLLFVAISLLLAEGIVAVMGLLLVGRITWDYLLTGLVASFLVASVILGIVLRLTGEVKRLHETLAESEEKLRGLYELSPLGIALTDMNGRYVDFNEAFRSICGYTEEELKGLDYWTLTPRQYEEEEARQLQSLARTGRYGPYEKEYLRKDGRRIPLRLNGVLVKGSDEESYIWSIVEDISARKQTEERLKLAASVFEHAHEGICITDAQARIIEVNPTFTEVTGYSREEVIGRPPSLLKSGIHPPEFYTALWEALNRQGYWRGEIWNRRKSGEAYPELLTISAVLEEEGGISHYVGIFTDISRIKEHEQQLERIAHFDALTGIPNRVLLADRMRQAIAQTRRNNQLMAVCYLDLDGFKPVNDLHGHEAGDRLLVEMARRLNGLLRGGDTVARLGGDEFVLLLLGLHRIDEAESALRRFLDAIGRPFAVGGLHTNISASIGFTLYPMDDADPDTLLRHADQAMYSAKQQGRNRFHLFDLELDRRARAHRAAIGSIEAAFERREFVLFYQPKVNMRLGQVVGAEALVRWQHPERGLLPPAEFLPLIEEHKLIVSLGEWVIDAALRQLAAWREEGLDLSVSINVAARQLSSPDFSQRLAELLAAHPAVPAERVELEILETAALEDISRVSVIVEEGRQLGLSFSLDDFGTGYSSLTYFKRLPAETLKIDKSFVQEMLRDPEDLAIVEGLIGLSEVFGRKVIAEGVETVEHGLYLLHLGCELAQGYGIARPMPAQELPGWIRNWRPDPRWRSAGTYRWPREDLPLIMAENDHQRWIDALIGRIEGGGPVPDFDVQHWRFERWCERVGHLRYGTMPEFSALSAVHTELHALGHELLELAARGSFEEARDRIPDLLLLRDRLVALLQRLLQAAKSGEGEERGRQIKA